MLAAAFRGDLTVDWRANPAGDRKIHNEWKKKPLIDLCDRERAITYGVIKLGPEVVDGTPCLRTSNVRWLRVDLDGMKRISPALSLEYARTINSEYLAYARFRRAGRASRIRRPASRKESRTLVSI